MKRLSLISIAALAAFSFAASYLTVDAVIKDAKKHDKKDVLVRGRVDKFTEKTSKRGNKYTTFKLQGEKSTLNVFMQDHLAKDPKKGDIVEVNGVFRESKTVGTSVYKNEVEATKVAGKKYGVKIISTSK